MVKQNYASFILCRVFLLGTCQRFGLQPEIRRKLFSKGSIQAIILRDSSKITGMFSGREDCTRIRLEIDTNPPEGAAFRAAFLNFPIPHELTVMDLQSSFALQCHALPFVGGEERMSVESWSREMFIHYLNKSFAGGGSFS